MLHMNLLLAAFLPLVVAVQSQIDQLSKISRNDTSPYPKEPSVAISSHDLFSNRPTRFEQLLVPDSFSGQGFQSIFRSALDNLDTLEKKLYEESNLEIPNWSVMEFVDLRQKQVPEYLGGYLNLIGKMELFLNSAELTFKTNAGDPLLKVAMDLQPTNGQNSEVEAQVTKLINDLVWSRGVSNITSFHVTGEATFFGAAYKVETGVLDFIAMESTRIHMFSDLLSLSFVTVPVFLEAFGVKSILVSDTTISISCGIQVKSEHPVDIMIRNLGRFGFDIKNGLNTRHITQSVQAFRSLEEVSSSLGKNVILPLIVTIGLIIEIILHRSKGGILPPYDPDNIRDDVFPLPQYEKFEAGLDLERGATFLNEFPPNTLNSLETAFKGTDVLLESTYSFPSIAFALRKIPGYPFEEPVPTLEVSELDLESRLQNIALRTTHLTCFQTNIPLRPRLLHDRKYGDMSGCEVLPADADSIGCYYEVTIKCDRNKTEKMNCITIGYASCPYPSFLPPGAMPNSIGYDSTGHLSYNGTEENWGPYPFKEGDTIGVGYTAAIREGDWLVTFYLTLNGTKILCALKTDPGDFLPMNMYPSISAQADCELDIMYQCS